MHPRRPSPEHQEAVSRRLAQLSAELAGERPDLDPPTRPRPPTSPGDAPYPMSAHTRVTARRPPPAPAPAPAPAADPVTGAPPLEDASDGGPPLVKPPGRHAARRIGRTVADAVPDTVRGRFTLGPAQLALVAVLVAAGLAVTTWWVVRGDASPVPGPGLRSPVAGLATPADPAPGPPGSSGPSGPSGSAGHAGKVTVDVAGKVRRPGIAVLAAGSRVVDALKAAGGARPGVDLTSLNLARVLVDGEQILVGTAVPAGAGTAGVPAPPGAGPLVNLNTAGVAELETLPDVGPVTAEAIIAWRTEHGGFTAVDELLEVDGIGEATLATLTPHVTV